MNHKFQFELFKEILEHRINLFRAIVSIIVEFQNKPMVIATPITGTIFNVESDFVYYPGFKVRHDDMVHGQFLCLFHQLNFVQTYLPNCDGMEFLARVQHGYDVDTFPREEILKSVNYRNEKFWNFLDDKQIEVCMKAIEALFNFMIEYKNSEHFKMNNSYLNPGFVAGLMRTDLPDNVSELRNIAENAVRKFIEISPEYFFQHHIDRSEIIKLWQEYE